MAMSRSKDNFTKYAKRSRLWYWVELDDGQEFRVLEITGDANVGSKGRFMTPAEEYRYEFGTIKFPSINRMEVHTNANDRTRIMWASLGRIVASSRVSDDDGLSLSRCDQHGWAEDQIPKVNNFEARADMKSPVALVIRLPNQAKGNIFSDMGSISYPTNEGRFLIAYGTERRENGIILPERFDRSQRLRARAATAEIIQAISTQTHAYRVLCEQFKLVSDRFMYAVSSVDKAMAKREMENLRGKMEFEAMTMQIRADERFDEVAWVRTYETDAEKVALMRMRHGPNMGAHDTETESDGEDPGAGPSKPQVEQSPTPLPEARSNAVPNAVPLVAPMMTAEQMTQFKNEMGQFFLGMVQQCVQQIPQCTAQAIALAQIEHKAESDCELIDQDDSSMHTAVGIVAAMDPTGDGAIVTSTPDASSDELVIDESPMEVKELLEQGW